MNNYFVKVLEGDKWVTHQWEADSVSSQDGHLYFTSYLKDKYTVTKLVSKGFWSDVEIIIKAEKDAVK